MAQEPIAGSDGPSRQTTPEGNDPWAELPEGYQSFLRCLYLPGVTDTLKLPRLKAQHQGLGLSSILAQLEVLSAVAQENDGEPAYWQPDTLASIITESKARHVRDHFSLPTLLAEGAQELLEAARDAGSDSSVRSGWQQFEDVVFTDAVDLLGGAHVIGMAVRDESDLLRAISLGLPAQVLGSLRQIGFRAEELERVIAPRRTLARRKAGGQRFTRAESDSTWRLAHALALGARVLKGPEAALAWLRRPKAALGDQIPMELIDTAVGARAIERLLIQLELGDVA